MVEPVTLLRDLRGLIQTLGDELRHQDPGDAAGLQDLRATYAMAVTAGRTSESWTTWREERVEEIVTEWVIGTVLVRYAEDNGFILAKEPHGEAVAWWRSRFEDLAAGLATDPSAIIPASAASLPESVTQLLTTFWQRRDQQHRPIYDFTDPTLDTQFLGDLYQDLSVPARARYALLQTPAFVAQFILDQTLDPAVERRGLDGFTMLDPVCGSGSFLLGAFHRLFTRWTRTAPALPTAELARRAMDSIHGVDVNPVAVMITRFRLLIAARAALGGPKASDASASPWPLHIALGDALLDADHDLKREPDLLRPGRYDTVVGNPPYITVKDRALDQLYRERYDVCVGKYSLSVPFVQRCFELARAGDEQHAGGYVGLFIANSFTKREFGRKLVTEFFATRIALTHVFDTSGAFIPGHGTPTLILIGRNRPRHVSDQVLVVAGLHGEPSAPKDPARGHVWQSIVRHADQPGLADRWTESRLLAHAALEVFPWALASQRSTTLHGRISGSRRLGDVASRIAYLANTGADDIFTAPPGAWTRFHTETAHVVGVVTGSEVRDWTATPSRWAFFPRKDNLDVVDIHDLPGHHHRLWPHRTMLSNRPYYAGRTFSAGQRAWYDWHSVSGAPEPRHRRIAFAWVATHTHFAALDDVLALPSAPVIELSSDISAEQLAGLVAVLNSSTVCFWLKQVSASKGSSSVHHSPGTGGEPWEDMYQFTPARLRELPLPDVWATQYGTALARLADELVDTTPAAVLARGIPSAERLNAGRVRWDEIRAQMIALAEEQDWATYGHYGLLPDHSLASVPSKLPALQLGERAFEIALARAIETGSTDRTRWFTRHGSTAITEPPAHWPSDYRDLVNARIAAIATDPQLNVLERPEFKRRWAGPTWESLQAAALQEWLLDRCERALSQQTLEGRERPRPRTIEWLAHALQSDPSVLEAANLIASGKNLTYVLHELLADEHVPCLAALRFKESGIAKRLGWESVWLQQRREDAAHADDGATPAGETTTQLEKYVSSDFLKPSYWQLRGKFDVPTERFISYPQTRAHDNGILLGWAGWDYLEQEHALADLIVETLTAEAADKDAAVVLLAALHELQQWGTPFVEPTRPPSPVSLQRWLDQLGITLDDLVNWRPRPPKRGRPKKART